jgi:hypothetical protein
MIPIDMNIEWFHYINGDKSSQAIDYKDVSKGITRTRNMKPHIRSFIEHCVEQF